MLNNCKLTSFLSKNDDDDDEKVCVWVMIKIFLQWFKIRNSSMPGFQVIKMEIRTIWVNSCKFDFYDFVPFWFLIRFSSAFMATISILPSGLKAFLQIFNFRSPNFYIAAMLSEQIEELSFLFFFCWAWKKPNFIEIVLYRKLRNYRMMWNENQDKPLPGFLLSNQQLFWFTMIHSTCNKGWIG